VATDAVIPVLWCFAQGYIPIPRLFLTYINDLLHVAQSSIIRLCRRQRIHGHQRQRWLQQDSNKDWHKTHGLPLREVQRPTRHKQITYSPLELSYTGCWMRSTRPLTRVLHSQAAVLEQTHVNTVLEETRPNESITTKECECVESLGEGVRWIKLQ